ncbi:MAG: DUF3089 domain-containing protein [Paludibacteraceae bacterium]|nr:DUF3089 domain-containing protein [Paludibacteraceae bacterium]
MKHTSFFWFFVLISTLTACQHSPWNKSEAWYNTYDSITHEADLFYILSTEIISSQDDEGQEVYNAVLTQAERELLDQEASFIASQLGDSMNVYIPYYHQFTMNSILLPQDSFQLAYNHAQQEIEDAFAYYIQHLNRQRPFVLVGFSQGAMYIPTLLRKMDGNAYQRCKGAYMMGYRLTAEDLQDSRLQPATGALNGKVISFNSVTTPDKQWPFISGDAATCINPLNWTTDATPAVLYYQQDTIIIVQDTTSHLLLCDVDPERYYLPGTEPWYQHGCLHHWDILFYNKHLHRNIIQRCYGSL